MGLFKRDTAIPRPGPAGGVFHIEPMGNSALKKLARGITKIDYVRDGKQRMVFGPDKKAIPTFDVDEDTLLAEALKRCKRIDEVTEEIYDTRGDVTGEQLVIDAKAKEIGLPDGTLIDPVLISAVLDAIVDVEREVDVEEPSPKIDEAAGDVVEITAESGAIEKPATVKKKVTQTMSHAEWVLGEAAELGQARITKAIKNS